MHYFKK